ncbi:MAG: glycosyltransferase family 4 protein [bacterium]|nr:glycosyltransferase family 4 protein [bacterium]
MVRADFSADGLVRQPARQDAVAVIGLRRFPNYIGGIETHCEQLYTAMQGHADAPVIHIFMRSVDPDVRYPDGLHIHNVWAPKGFGIETFFHSLFSLLIARISCRISLVHFHGIGPAIWTPLARILGARVIVTHHAADFQRPKWSVIGKTLLQAGEYMAARYANYIICISHAVADEFLDRHDGAGARTTIICHGLQQLGEDEDILGRLGLSSRGYIFVAGRFDRTKRFEDVIAAHRLAACPLPLVIAGTSAGEPDYDARLLGDAGPNVIFAGLMRPEQMTSLYTHAALFVHASQMEGCGLVVLEALRARAPVLVSDIPAHREFGLAEDHFFPPGDIAALKAKLCGPFERESMQVYAAIDRHHDFSAMLDAHIAVYRSALCDEQNSFQ